MFMEGRLSFRSGNLDEIDAALSRNAAGRLLKAPTPYPDEIDFLVNTLPLKCIEIVEAISNTALTNIVEPQDRSRLVVPVDGVLDLGLDSREIESIQARGVYCIPATQAWRSKQRRAYHVISIRIDHAKASEVLSALIDAPCESLAFDPEIATGVKGFLLRSSALQFVNDMHALSDEVIPSFTERFESIFATRLLLLGKHNYSSRFDTEHLSASEKQLSRVEDYIYDHLGEPIDVIALAHVAGTSLSGLFRAFKRYRGISPATFVRQTRLASARVLLETSNTLSVQHVARICGFRSSGHFSTAYFAAHGEYPSETLKGGIANQASHIAS